MHFSLSLNLHPPMLYYMPDISMRKARKVETNSFRISKPARKQGIEAKHKNASIKTVLESLLKYLNMYNSITFYFLSFAFLRASSSSGGSWLCFSASMIKSLKKSPIASTLAYSFCSSSSSSSLGCSSSLSLSIANYCYFCNLSSFYKFRGSNYQGFKPLYTVLMEGNRCYQGLSFCALFVVGVSLHLRKLE